MTTKKVFDREKQICNLIYIDLILCMKKYQLYKLDYTNHNYDSQIKDKDRCNYIIKIYNNICL